MLPASFAFSTASWGAACGRRKESSDSVERRAAHRMVQQIVGRAVETQGRGLAEV